MAELGWAQLALVAWLAAELATAAVFVTRGGYRNLLWYLVGGLPGPLLVPIVVERGRAARQRFDVRFRAPAPTRPGLARAGRPGRLTRLRPGAARRRPRADRDHQRAGPGHRHRPGPG
ncbi:MULTISPECIES: hypothetical protein [Micromonospora]|uniref:hypothetical protein n=1 Tax=Micromonospora TaxID=1873 RepID=UPI001FC93261|nr:hypothetical protein [Micromonospora inaquosa]WSK49809.1 hypothetical protein OG423_05305 [Micromonospora zamorensis]